MIKLLDFFLFNHNYFLLTNKNATAIDADPDPDRPSLVLPQDSLIRLLMNIEVVLPRLMQSILKRFVVFAKEPLPSEITLPSLIL